MTFTLAFAALLLLAWVVLAQDVFRGNRRMKRLATLSAPAPSAWPRVSIVIAARTA